MMDEWEMAAALAWALNKSPWKAKDDGLGEIEFTNEGGERFRLTVEKIDDDEAA